jgi:transposase-like protein
VIVTDKLKSYAAAQRAIVPAVEHRQSRYLVITSMPISIARLAMPRSARGTVLPSFPSRRRSSPFWWKSKVL